MPQLLSIMWGPRVRWTVPTGENILVSSTCMVPSCGESLQQLERNRKPIFLTVLILWSAVVRLLLTSLRIPWGASLVAQWLRICLPMQGTRVRALVWEDPTCRGATKPVRHNYWACASGACAPQQEKPRQWGACAPQRRVAPLDATRESPYAARKTQRSQKWIRN